MERKNPFQPMDTRPLPPSGERPLEVALLRGAAKESLHRVHALICDFEGNTIEHWGDPSLTFFPRSSVKLIQALSWVIPKFGEKFTLGEEELSLACGSHEGEKVHTEIVSRWLKKLQLKESDLECGAHEPYHRPSARALWAKGEAPCQIHNNCSGKHCGFLTACLGEGWPTLGYTSYDHPLQAKVREYLGEFFGQNMDARPWGIDGCGIPTYSLPLKSVALAMARIAESKKLGSQIHEAVGALNGAIAARPELIGGSESFSSKVVAHSEGRVFAKMGAEGVYGVWIPRDGLGIAVKCEDGATRGAEVALASILGELGHPLSFFQSDIQRWSGEIVGQLVSG